MFSAFRSVSRTRLKLNGSIKYQSPGDTLSILIALSLCDNSRNTKNLSFYMSCISSASSLFRVRLNRLLSRVSPFSIENRLNVSTTDESIHRNNPPAHNVIVCRIAKRLSIIILVDAFCLFRHFDWRRIATSPSVITRSSPYMNCSRFAN